MILYERLVVPPAHLGVLVEPAGPQIHAWLRPGPTAAPADAPILDTTCGALRAALRETLELRGPTIVTGHQAEFIHAGVFAKSLAAHALAARTGGEAVFLMVDGDTPKTAQVVLPQLTGAGLRRVYVAIPGCDIQRSFEAQPRQSRAAWLQFFASVAALHERRDYCPLDSFARAWLTTADPQPHYCEALTRAQLAVEAELGLPGIRALRMSRLCATPAFRAFASHLLLAARRCATLYNAAQIAYRERHRVRAPGRPVPPLAMQDERTELPFWIVRRDEPRQRLFAIERQRTVELIAGQTPVGTLSRADLARSAWHAAEWPSERAGWCLRPRALALSMFARYFLADLFIHGIGGAKYDELMEDFATGFLGAAPAPACCVSATVRLPLSTSGVRPADIRAARRASRDVRFNPHRYVPGIARTLLEQRAALVRRSEDLRRHQPHDHVTRQVVFREIRRTNEQMLAVDPWRVAQVDQRGETLAAQWGVDQVALEREYFFALHPYDALRALTARVRDEVG